MSKALALLLVLSAGMAVPALAETDAEKAEKAAKLKAAIELCDKGAAIPLDPSATEPPVTYLELYLSNSNRDRLKSTVAACDVARQGAPDLKRLKLQWLRTALALGERQPFELLADIETYAKEGSAEANFLIFAFYRYNADQTLVSRDDAIKALTRAAVAGHMSALDLIVNEYRVGPDLSRDPRKVAHWAERMLSLPQQGKSPTAPEESARAFARGALGAILVETPDVFSPEEQARGFAIVKELYDTDVYSGLIPYATALRYGRGTPQDTAGAKKVLEEAVAAGRADAIAPLADMLANGEGGPVDGKAAMALLRGDLAKRNGASRMVLAELLLDNRFTGRMPREATRLYASAFGVDARIRTAELLANYGEKLEHPDALKGSLEDAVAVEEPGAAMAFARLKLSDHSQFEDVEGARAILIGLAAKGDREAALLVAETQYANLDSTSFKPSRREGGMSDKEIEALIDKGIADGLAGAWRVKGKLLRVGVIYPQDDAAATAALVEAAKLGDVEAMILAGEAYDDGLGVKEDPRERLRWWREAARLGSIEARQNLVDAFTFDSFDKLMTLREGITEQVALYNDSLGDFERTGVGDDLFASTGFSGTFSGGRAGEAGIGALAAAVMEGFRIAPAGLGDDKLVPLMRAFPEEIRIAIEQVLKEEGFYAGSPDGFFGPEVRKALASWVEAKGPVREDSRVVEAKAEAAPAAADEIPPETIARLRDAAFATAREAKNEKDRAAALDVLAALARAGDPVTRFAIVSNYHRADVVRTLVTPEEVTRYGLDLLVLRPEGAEKVEFEVIFDVSALYEAGAIDAFGKAVVAAVRDDERLRDPLTLGGIMEQLNFAPGACDAIAKAAKDAGVGDAGDDGCAEAARVALIAFAKASGPAGIESAARAAAVAELKKLDDGG